MGFWDWVTGANTNPVVAESAYRATPTIQYSEPIGPMKFDTPDAGEFGPIEYVGQQISKAQVSVQRIISATSQQADKQAELPWWNITGRISNAASSANEALQSTMVKVIVLVVVVGVIALFGMSYVQAKGVQLAK